MRISSKNAGIFLRIMVAWIRSVALILFSNASSYLGKSIRESNPAQILSHEDWIIARKIVKGTRKISPLINKRRRCLMEALIVHRTLSQYGIFSEIKVGTGKENNQLKAHAWIVLDEKVLIGGALSGYTELIKTH
jgi:hypothetical protein